MLHSFFFELRLFRLLNYFLLLFLFLFLFADAGCYILRVVDGDFVIIFVNRILLLSWELLLLFAFFSFLDSWPNLSVPFTHC